MSDDEKEVVAEGETPVQPPAPPEPDPALAVEVKEETNAEAASGDRGEVASEGEKSIQPPTPSEPAPSPAAGEAQEEIKAEATSRDDTGGERPTKRPTSSNKSDHPLAPGRVKRKNIAEIPNGDTAETAAARARIVPPPIPAKPEHSVTSERAKRVKKERRRHLLLALVHILVEVFLCLATSWLIYATYLLVGATLDLKAATVELRDRTSGLVSVTVEELKANKHHSTSSDSQNKKNHESVGVDLDNAKKKLEEIKRILPINFDVEDKPYCKVSEENGKRVLREAQYCVFLKVLIQDPENLAPRSRIQIKFTRNGRSWECPPADPGDNERVMTTNLKSCFEQYHQERRGDIEFIVEAKQ